jgi:cell division septation protein DedD
MNSKEYRELQLSSSQLVIIFLAIIILGVVIFLLGVSVGKKQSQIVLASQSGTENVIEQVTQQEPIPAEKPGEKTLEKKETSPESKPKTEKTTPVQPPQNLVWFIQVGAFNNRQGAQAIADGFKRDGYDAHVLEPYSSDRTSVFRVRIGGYATKELAEQAKAQMVKADPKAADYFVIRQR